MHSDDRDRPQPREDVRPGDARLYVPDAEGWKAHVKRGWDKEYCFFQNPGEDYCHLLMSGEIYLQRGTEKICLSCAVRHGIATTERLNWQKGAPSRRPEGTRS